MEIVQIMRIVNLGSQVVKDVDKLVKDALAADALMRSMGGF